MKRYFLMSQGDFFVHLVDMARDELAKNLADIQDERMSALIELAQRTSTAASDPHKDDLQCVTCARDTPQTKQKQLKTPMGRCLFFTHSPALLLLH